MDHELKNELSVILKKSKQKVRNNQFQEAFELIKKESDILIESKLEQLRELQKKVKKESKSRQKLYVLFRYLQEKLEESEEHIIEKVAEDIQEVKNKVIEERNRIIIEEFDTFVSEKIEECRKKLITYKNELEQKDLSDLNVKEVSNGFNAILSYFNDLDNSYNNKLNKNRSLIENFDEKSNLTIMQWERFKEYIENEIQNLKKEYINDFINKKILLLAKKSDSSYLTIRDIAKYIDMRIKETGPRIKQMIEISKINGTLIENDEILLLYTDHYYKNKELRNFINNKIIKYNNQTIGKTLALYDSCIKNRTLKINLEELTERIKDLEDFDKVIRERFNNKVKELDIDIESKKEYKASRKYFQNIITDSQIAIKSIENNLIIFKNLQNFIDKKYTQLKENFFSFVNKMSKDIEESDSYDSIKETFEQKKEKYDSIIENTEEEILDTLEEVLEEDENTKKLSPEIREYFITRKNEFITKFNEEMKNLNHNLLIKKNELFRDSLVNYINTSKIQLSHLLGKLQTRIEDYIDTNEFKRASSRLDKRVENIEDTINEINAQLRSIIKEFNRQAIDFETKNKHILIDFSKYIDEFKVVLCEKSKSLESDILKNFIQMAIKAVANEFLTIGFIKKEIKLKKQNIQDHLLSLISSEELTGKYDPRLNVYYEDPEVLDKLDEDELKVIKSMNYKVYRFLNRFKNITKHYYPIIAFFASFLTLSFYLMRFANWNPWILLIPGVIIASIIYLVIWRKKDEV